jgi:hypothetical protein
MWGHLKDVGFKVDLKSIVNAVAPPVESDDDDEYDDSGDDDSQDDDIVSVDENEPVVTEPQYEDDDDEYEDEQPRGFGLVGMLSRALDSEQNRYEDSQSHEEEEDQLEEEDQFVQDEVRDLNPIVNTSMSARSFHSDSYSDSFLGESMTDIDMHAEDNVHHASCLEQASYLEQALYSPQSPNKQPEKNLATNPAPAAQVVDSSENEAPLRRSLVRESGSLSPADAYGRGIVKVPVPPSVELPTVGVMESATKQQKIPEGEHISTASKGKDDESAPTSARKSRLARPRRSEPAASVATTSVTKPTARASPPIPASRAPPRSSSDMKSLDNLPQLPSFIEPGPEETITEVEQSDNAALTGKDTDSDRSSDKSASVVETAATASAAKVDSVSRNRQINSEAKMRQW